jgi:hypothetical protein
MRSRYGGLVGGFHLLVVLCHALLEAGYKWGLVTEENTKLRD